MQREDEGAVVRQGHLIAVVGIFLEKREKGETHRLGPEGLPSKQGS